MQLSGVFARAAVASLGYGRRLDESLVDAWALDPFAPATDLHVLTADRPPVLLRGVEFHKRPWERHELLPACGCPEPADSAGRARAWRVEGTPPVPTLRVSLQCTWCKRIVTLEAPPDAFVGARASDVVTMAGMHAVRLVLSDPVVEPTAKVVEKEARASGSSRRSRKRRRRGTGDRDDAAA